MSRQDKQISGVSLGQELAISTNRYQAVGGSRKLPGQKETSYTGSPKSKVSSQEDGGIQQTAQQKIGNTVDGQE